MRRGIRRNLLVAAALAVLLAGCAQAPVLPGRTDDRAGLGREPLHRFHLEGRIVVTVEGRVFSGSLVWERNAPETERLLLSGPLGQGVAEIRRLADGLEMRLADGRTAVAGDAESLLYAMTGVRLPTGALLYWLAALPHPATDFVAALGPGGGLDWLEQDGWRIEYDRYRERAGRALPGRLFARRGEGIELRLVIDRWEAGP